MGNGSISKQGWLQVTNLTGLYCGLTDKKYLGSYCEYGSDPGDLF